MNPLEIITDPGYSSDQKRFCCNPSCRRPIEFCDGYTKAGDVLDLWDGKRDTVRELCGNIASKDVAPDGGCAFNFRWTERGTLIPLTREEKINR